MKPPKKLVTFLQKNQDCLKYFHYLQTQLQNDVKQYRQRAEQYKRKVIRLEQQVMELKQNMEGDQRAVESDISDEDDTFELGQLQEMGTNDLNGSAHQELKVPRKQGKKRP